MSGSTSMEISTQSYRLANEAIGIALSALDSAGPLAPFAMTWQADGPRVERFMTGAYDDAIEMAMRHVSGAEDGIRSYAVVWSGYVDVDGSRTSAIVAEIGDRQGKRAIQVAQPYQARDGGALQAFGDLLALGESDNLLKTKLSAENLTAHLLQPAYITTEGMVHAITGQAYAQMPIALICLAANLFAGREAEHVSQGIHKLSALEADRTVAMNHHIFSALAAAVADGNLMHVLPTDDVEELVQLVLAGGQQLKESVRNGRVCLDDAQAYGAAVRTVLEATLHEHGQGAIPEGGQRLFNLLAKAMA